MSYLWKELAEGLKFPCWPLISKLRQSGQVTGEIFFKSFLLTKYEYRRSSKGIWLLLLPKTLNHWWHRSFLLSNLNNFSWLSKHVPCVKLNLVWKKDVKMALPFGKRAEHSIILRTVAGRSRCGWDRRGQMVFWNKWYILFLQLGSRYHFFYFLNVHSFLKCISLKQRCGDSKSQKFMVKTLQATRGKGINSAWEPQLQFVGKRKWTATSIEHDLVRCTDCYDENKQKHFWNRMLSYPQKILVINPLSLGLKRSIRIFKEMTKYDYWIQ